MTAKEILLSLCKEVENKHMPAQLAAVYAWDQCLEAGIPIGHLIAEANALATDWAYDYWCRDDEIVEPIFEIAAAKLKLPTYAVRNLVSWVFSAYLGEWPFETMVAIPDARVTPILGDQKRGLLAVNRKTRGHFHIRSGCDLNETTDRLFAWVANGCKTKE